VAPGAAPQRHHARLAEWLADEHQHRSQSGHDAGAVGVGLAQAEPPLDVLPGLVSPSPSLRSRRMPAYGVPAASAGWTYHVLWTMRQAPSIRSMDRSSLYHSPANWAPSLTSAVSPWNDRPPIRHP
jgi:hypothetical protein